MKGGREGKCKAKILIKNWNELITYNTDRNSELQ